MKIHAKKIRPENHKKCKNEKKITIELFEIDSKNNEQPKNRKK
jgi:hypothetical protein